MHSHGRGCRAKKQVQQQDNISGSRPMYQVTYVNEHTCHQVPPDQDMSASRPLTPTNNKNISTTRSGHFDQPQHQVVDGNVELENNIMTWTLRTVMEASLGEPAMSHAPSLLDVSMGLDGLQFPPVDEPAAPPLSWSLPPLPVEASSSYPAGGGNLPSIDAMTMEEMYFMCGPLFSPVAAQSNSHWGNQPMADGRFPDTASSAWQQHS
jgi:hypothetical protein